LTITRGRSLATRSPQESRAGRAAPAAPRPANSLAPAPPAAAAAVLRLQRAYGNQAIQRVLPPVGRAAAPSGPSIQRWHDAEHDSSTQAGLAVGGKAALMVPIFGHDPRYDTAPKIAARLGDASINMDRVVPQASPTKESHNLGRLGSGIAFGASSLFSAARNDIGNFFGSKSVPTTRGVIGEGPDHGEAGKYYTPVGGGAPGNLAREDFYIDASIDALQAGDIDKALNKLGDAAHVSADRGSHGEGDKGRGHDTPHPPPGQNGTQMPNFMEKFDDCDNQGLNPNGYAYGVARTSEMFGRFLGKAQNLDQGDQDLDADGQENGDIELDEF
jgi:hypothetical protein